MSLKDKVKIVGLKQLTETPLARIFRDRQGNEGVIAKSQIQYSFKSPEDEYTIEIPEWLAKRNPFDYE